MIFIFWKLDVIRQENILFPLVPPFALRHEDPPLSRQIRKADKIVTSLTYFLQNTK